MYAQGAVVNHRGTKGVSLFSHRFYYAIKEAMNVSSFSKY